TGQDFASTPANVVLTIQASHGSVARSPNQGSYVPGTPVTLTPTPDSGYSFGGWSGAVPPGHELDNPLQVTMDVNRTIAASFLRASVTAAEYFDRPNEIPLATGGNWGTSLVSQGAADLANHQIAGGFGEAVYFWQGGGSFDPTHQYARARVVNPNGQVGLVVLGGPGQALIAAWKSGTLYVYWYSSGTY